MKMVNAQLPIDMTIPALAEACEQHTQLFRKASAHDDAFCLELFRRAVLRGVGEAWQAIITQYQRMVAGWVCQHLDCNQYEPEDLVNETFARFQRSFTTDKFHAYGLLQSVLAYLRRCAYTAVCDFQRRQQRRQAEVESLDDEGVSERLSTSRAGLEQAVFAKLRAEQIWEIVLRQCQNQAEQLLAHRIFVEGWKPDQIHLAQREQYPNVQAVYSALRNLRDRLKRDQAMAVLLKDYAEGV